MTSATHFGRRGVGIGNTGDYANGRKDFLPWFFFFLTIATRIPFTSKLLFNMDSGQFAMALEKFDITVHQPHPPGYFLYIMLGRLLNVFIADANAVFVSISVLFSGLAVVAVYLLGREIFERNIGAVAALLALSSPNMWFHGEVSLTYIMEAFFSTIAALLCWRNLKGEGKYLWITAIVLGVAGGIRQNTPIFLLPLWIYSVRNLPLGKILASLGVMAGTCLFWFVPMVWLSGGWDAYRGAFRELWMFHTGGHSVFENGWESFQLFSFTILRYVVYGLGAGMYPLALAVYSLAKRGKWKTVDPTKAIFFAFWVVPVLIFYLFVFISIQNPGYALIFLPALLILASFSIFHIGNELKVGYGGKVVSSIVTAVMVLNSAAFFLLTCPVSYRWIRAHDRVLSVLLADIRTFDPPAETALFVNNYIYYSYRHLMYYLPEYRVYNVDVRTAPTGERRKTFWGVGGKTFLQEEVIIPEGVVRFATPIHRDDGKFREREAYANEGIEVRDVTPNLFLASGPVGLLTRIYPELQGSFKRNGKRS